MTRTRFQIMFIQYFSNMRTSLTSFLTPCVRCLPRDGGRPRIPPNCSQRRDHVTDHMIMTVAGMIHASLSLSGKGMI